MNEIRRTQDGTVKCNTLDAPRRGVNTINTTTETVRVESIPKWAIWACLGIGVGNMMLLAWGVINGLV